MVFMPARTSWEGWDEGDATGCYLAVAIEPEFVQDVFGAHADTLVDAFTPAIGFRDSMIEMALHQIAVELIQPDTVSGAFVEGQVTLLLSCLARSHNSRREVQKGGLSPFAVKRVDQMIDASSQDAMRIADMAREIGVTPCHFCRAFRQTMGKTPRQYIAQRRIDRSLDLLRTTTLSMTEIALECGFSSSSHFSVAFKRAFGVGPAKYRLSWKV